MIILVLAILTVLLRGITTLLFQVQAHSWQKKASSLISDKTNSNTKFHILIPVLREQTRIVGTLKYFLDNFREKNIQLTVVTTQREFDKKFTGNSTNQIVKEFTKKNKCSDYISVIDCPDAKGRMAHQLNYALEKIDKDSYIAIYNADSRPHKDTLKYASQMISQNKAEVFQQPAIFIKNYDKLNPFLRASAILQSRWTFAHEIARLLRQSVYSNNLFRKYAYAHVVGHGLIIKKGVLDEVGGFPTGTMTEDLFLGYLLRSKGHNIFPIPFLELADAPETVKGLWNQKYVWFWGPMKNMDYFQYVSKYKSKLGIKSLLPSLVFTLEGLQSALAWLLSAPLVLLLLLSPIFTHDMTLILVSYLSVFIYGPLQYLIFYYSSKEYFSKFNIQEGFSIGVLSVSAIIFNSIPPYFSIFNELKSHITKQEINKPKTDE
jgi:cellulose synthase/poly-beta-1,6-N-acetylglucosamine synthase-like glycosyltransferase